MDLVNFENIMKMYCQDIVLDKVLAMDEKDRNRILRQCDFLDFSFLKALNDKESERGLIEPIRTMKLSEIEELCTSGFTGTDNLNLLYVG